MSAPRAIGPRPAAGATSVAPTPGTSSGADDEGSSTGPASRRRPRGTRAAGNFSPRRRRRCLRAPRPRARRACARRSAGAPPAAARSLAAAACGSRAPPPRRTPRRGCSRPACQGGGGPAIVAFVHFRASPTWFQYSTAVAGAAGLVSFIIDARKSRRRMRLRSGTTPTGRRRRRRRSAPSTPSTSRRSPEPEPAATAAAAPAASAAGAAAAAAAPATAAAAAAAAAARDIVRSADGTVQAFSDRAARCGCAGARRDGRAARAAATLGGAPRLVGFTVTANSSSSRRRYGGAEHAPSPSPMARAT